jgi:uncharacterized iron-regulated membrane protein
MRPALHRLWLRLHRWVGLSLGAVLALTALTGASLIALRPLDQWLHPALFAAPAPGAAPASLDSVRGVLTSRYGTGSSFTLRPPREAGDTLWVYVRGSWDGTAYVDPATARILGQRGEREGLPNLLFEFHSSLLLGDPGRPVMAVLALTYLFLLVTGLALWWPRNWARAWTLHLKGGATRSLFDLHRTGGSLLGLLVAVSIFSGVYMAWKPLSGLVTMVAGDTTTQPPEITPVQGARAPLDAMALRAQALFPDARIGYVQLSPKPTRPVRFRLKLPDDPHPNGLTSVWLHPVTGQVTAVHRWDELDAGAHATSYLYPLHTGALGGIWHEALNAAVGLALFGLAGTGAWLWWRRRCPGRLPTGLSGLTRD